MIRPIPGNQVVLLRNGVEYFPALETAIAGARREIYLESYIYDGDATGWRIAQALAAAARRGVAVRVLLDGFGSKTLARALIDELRGAGVRVLFFRPEVSAFALRRHRLRRLHRKLVVIDGRMAYVGGINIIDDTQTPHQLPPRFDYAVAVEGPVLTDIHRAVQQMWMRVAWSQFRWRGNRRRSPSPYQGNGGAMQAAFVIRDNLRHRRDIEAAYLEAIGSARREIIIANAYFLPGRKFRRALIDAALRGVSVVLLLQGRVEYLLLHYASRALYGVLLDAGVEILEYHRSFLHAKVAVIDGRWATVGSSNIDPFSLMLAREANLVVMDEGFAATLKESLARAMHDGARRVQPAHWKRQPPYRRFFSWVGYGVVRWLMGMAGYGRKYDEV